MNTKNKSDKTDLVACAIFLKKKKIQIQSTSRTAATDSIALGATGKSDQSRAAQSLALLSDSSEYTYKAVGRDSRSVTAAYRGR